jgi:hypothetical protein
MKEKLKLKFFFDPYFKSKIKFRVESSLLGNW